MFLSKASNYEVFKEKNPHYRIAIMSKLGVLLMLVSFWWVITYGVRAEDGLILRWWEVLHKNGA